MSTLATNQSQNKPFSPQISIPEELFKKWDINQYFRITNQHIVLSATQKNTDTCRVLTIIPNSCFHKKLWKNLIRLPDDKLLLPQKIYVMDNVHILEFPIYIPLKNLIQTETLSFIQIISLIQDLCSSLNCLHNIGILHMDISADNVYLTNEKTFILGDFSESCYLSEVKPVCSNWQLHGMAPECQKKSPTKLSEQYQLGLLFYQLCNNGNAPPDDFYGIIPDTLPVLQFIPKIADSLQAILSKMLAFDPSDRYLNLSDLQDDLNVLKNMDNFSAYALKETNYQLFLPDTTHPFHQTRTIQNIANTERNFHFIPFSVTAFSFPSIHLPSIRFSFSIFPLVLVCMLLVLIFSQKFLSAKNTSHSNTMDSNRKTTTGSAVSYSITSVGNITENAENMGSANQENTTVDTILDIAGKNITTLYYSIDFSEQNKDSIQVILAENNNISSLDDISLFPNLRELYLSNNQITDLSELVNLSDLETLVLSDNYCTNISCLNSLHKLRFLDLSGNSDLAEIHDLYNLTSLETLILSDTSVSQKSIKQLQQTLPNCNIIF